MSDFIVKSLRAGMNNSDPSIALAEDQCVLAQNVEWTSSMLGERRRGSEAIDVTGSDLVGKDRVTFLHRHLPTTDETAAQLWALGVTGTASSSLVYKDTTWHTVSPSDAITLTSGAQYQVRAQTRGAKLFLAFKSAVDRLHVWDGTTLRRTGLAEPAAPTSAETGVGGAYTGTRYFRVRYTVKSGSTVLRRSEPSDALTVAPSASKTGTIVTKPATISESETHWELEASLDNANFYRIADTLVGTTTVTDTTAYTSGYANVSGAVLSEDVGDYTLIGSAKYLAADEDRLVWAGNHEDSTKASTVGWSPVGNADGVGNDERMESDTDPELTLDAREGGDITGLSAPVAGSLWAFKYSRIFKLIRRGQRTRAYEAIPITSQRGAIDGSVIPGVDQTGNPCLYFLDPQVGPCRLGRQGLQWAGGDIWETWKTVNVDASSVVSRSLFYPENRQVHWWIATVDSNVPDTRIVLHTHETRDAEDGCRRGWAIWIGGSCAALAACMFAENIDDDTARSLVLRPFIGVEGDGLIHRTDTSTSDNSTAYVAKIITKPYAPATILNQFGVTAGSLLAKAVTDATINVTLTRDFGLETKTVYSVDLAPSDVETQVIKKLDDLVFSELTTLQVEFVDPGTPGSRWELQQFALQGRAEQTA